MRQTLGMQFWTLCVLFVALRATCWFCESVRFGLDSRHLFAPRRVTCAPSMGRILEVKVLS
nr:hypothetical protein [Pseudomonas syringae pv. theae]